MTNSISFKSLGPAMFETAMILIRAIWPYIRESLFEGGTVRQWFTKYRWSLTWFSLVFLLALINFFMFDQYIKLQIERNHIQSRYVETQKKYVIYRRAWEAHKGDNEKLTKQLNETKSKLSETEALLNEHQAWERRCGLSTAAIENGNGTCPVKVSTNRNAQSKKNRSTKTNTRQPTNNRDDSQDSPSFSERLKNLFGGGDKKND